MRIRKAEGYFGSGQANITGTPGARRHRSAARRVRAHGRLLARCRGARGARRGQGGGGRRARSHRARFIHNYEHDLDAFALYARTDARLAYRIVEKLRLVELAFARSRLTGMTPDRVAASIASFDFLYLANSSARASSRPTCKASDARVHVAQQGGHVLEPDAGLHPNVWVFDFKSLYPSLIRTFNIDPVGYVPAGAARRGPHRHAGRTFAAARRSCRGFWTSFSRAVKRPKGGTTRSPRTPSKS